MQLGEACPVEITKLVEFVDSKAGRSTNTDSQNRATQDKLGCVTDSWTPQGKSTAQHDTANKRWQGKRINGQLPPNLDEKMVGSEQSY